MGGVPSLNDLAVTLNTTNQIYAKLYGLIRAGLLSLVWTDKNVVDADQFTPDRDCVRGVVSIRFKSNPS